MTLALSGNIGISGDMTLSPAQCRAARGLVDWSQDRLADASRVSAVTIRNFEGGKISPHRATLDALQRALQEAGVEFTNGDAPGVRLRKAR
jgi:transcriptional regulator with XRE-family HTH domain